MCVYSSYLDEGVVEQKHDRGSPPGDLGVPEEVLANITHIANLGVTQTKFPYIGINMARHSCTQSIFRRAYQRTSDVYKTTAAMKTVKIIAGTSPRIEYDQGKDMMARQMYSEKSRAAVFPGAEQLVCRFTT